MPAENHGSRNLEGSARFTDWPPLFALDISRDLRVRPPAQTRGRRPHAEQGLPRAAPSEGDEVAPSDLRCSTGSSRAGSNQRRALTPWAAGGDLQCKPGAKGAIQLPKPLAGFLNAARGPSKCLATSAEGVNERAPWPADTTRPAARGPSYDKPRQPSTGAGMPRAAGPHAHARGRVGPGPATCADRTEKPAGGQPRQSACSECPRLCVSRQPEGSGGTPARGRAASSRGHGRVGTGGSAGGRGRAGGGRCSRTWTRAPHPSLRQVTYHRRCR